MKFRYFLRGFGIGIVFSAIVCMVAFQGEGSRKISDKEVIERAKELGMVEQQESIEDVLASQGIENDVTESKKNMEKASTKEADTENNGRDLASEKSTKEGTTVEQDTEKQTIEKTTEKTAKTTEVRMTEEKTTEKGTTEQNTTEVKNKSVTITIKGGSTSFPVCQKLQELGVIRDATEFDNYLIKNGYANRIRVGTHTLKIGMTYEEIAIAISDPV